MSKDKYYNREYLIKNGYDEYHIPEWIEVFRKWKRALKDKYNTLEYILERKHQ